MMVAAALALGNRHRLAQPAAIASAEQQADKIVDPSIIR
jgi:hypothetical protein